MDRAVLPYRSGDYPNFVEEPADASTFFDEGTWARLRMAKALYDPSDLFKGKPPHPARRLSRKGRAAAATTPRRAAL